MRNIVNPIIGDKSEWKAMEARANLLPRDYRILYGEMKSYMWRFTSVAAFCDERLRDTASYQDTWRASLNRDVAKKLAE